MSSLNLSTNGVAIKNSYQGVINGTLSSTSPTAARWALFTVQAPLLNVFQNTGSKESVLKVEATGEGELADLIEDFNEGRIQFAFVRVKDPNSGLPKNVFIAWCGGGVPERTKGYFTSHVAAVSKVLTGYHVQITARSDTDLEPEAIVKKVADASGAKYSAGSAPAPATAAAPPPVAKKPVFTPTTSTSGTSFNPLVAARNRRQDNTDDDGWGADAPPVSRTQIEKVAPAYKPIKVDIAGLRKNPDESRHSTPSQSDDQARDIVKGGYQPVGRVDVAALRAQAKQDDRPAVVRGAYEPVGKVDIAAIRAKTQRPVEASEEPSAPKSLAERSAAFAQSERLTELPKPKVAKKFGSTPFTGTKAPTPSGFGAASVPAPSPVGAASRTFADQGGKTPAQLWAEKKAKQGGSISSASPGPAPEITAQKSGSEWKSGYAGKSWAPVSTTNFGRGGVEKHATGGSGTERSQPEAEPETAAPSPGGITALRDRFKDQPPIGVSSRSAPAEEEAAPPPPPQASRPAGGFALPGLPSRLAPAEEEEEEEQQDPPVPSRNYEERDPSPVRIAVPVARSSVPDLEPPVEALPPRPVPVPEEIPREEDLPAEEDAYDPRAAAATVAAVASDTTRPGGAAPQSNTDGGLRAVVLFDYEKAEDNELELRENEIISNIDKVDPDWWMGTDAQGRSGLFPCNYVEILEADVAAPVPSAPAPVPAPAPAPGPSYASAPDSKSEYGVGSGPTATAQFDYEAAEDNELSFPEGATITNLDFPDEDWWFGHYKGASGLFPANYVELDQKP
ncbi:actin binding protein [Podospora pseudopauciseta]|uniref:Actin binding protein n=1 Tax=Podospora pseudopauciseta TaxID=2093780 RepID=A0ABR0I031_9PEZI|nr:actin binding protein [Podospora pseudopauciseta]